MDDRDRTHAAAHDAAHDAAHEAARAATGTAGEPHGHATRDGGISPAIGAPAGAVAGTMAGLQAGALAGALTLGLGAVAGAAMGAAAGAALAADSRRPGFGAEEEAHYRALYEGRPIADRRFDDVRAAYAYGHLAAAEPSLAGRAFDEVEPELRSGWNDELRRHAGPWEQVRRFVADAFGHARSEGLGARRVSGVVGSAGSAVDPEELARAQRGEPSVPELAATTMVAEGTPGTLHAGPSPRGVAERLDDATTRHEHARDLRDAGRADLAAGRADLDAMRDADLAARQRAHRDAGLVQDARDVRGVDPSPRPLDDRDGRDLRDVR